MTLRSALEALASGTYDQKSDVALRRELGRLLESLPRARQMSDIEQEFIDYLLRRRDELERLLAASEKKLPAFTCEVLKRVKFEEDRRTTLPGKLRKALDTALRGEGGRKIGGAKRSGRGRSPPTWPAKILRDNGAFDHGALRQAAGAARAEGCSEDHGALARRILEHFEMVVVTPHAGTSHADLAETGAQGATPADHYRRRHDSSRLVEEALALLSAAEKRALLDSIRDPARRGRPSRALTMAEEKLRRWCARHSEITFSLAPLMEIEIERQLEDLIDRVRADLK